MEIQSQLAQVQAHSPAQSLSAQSPTFSSASRSSRRLADIAARVANELNLHLSDPFHDDFYFHHEQDDIIHEYVDGEDNYENDASENHHQFDGEEEEEFEFAVLCNPSSYPSTSADEIFANGQIKPLFNYYPQQQSEPEPMRVPLRNLLFKDKDRCSSSASDDELDGVPRGTYCVWAPNKKDEDKVVMMKKKSKSTGENDGSNSKRWRIRDLLLLHRSNSDGKDTFVFLHHNNNNNNGGKNEGGGLLKRRERVSMVAKGKNTQKSYLPYRQDIVGFFSISNGISRTVRPF